MKVINIMPPLIKEYYSAKLLGIPAPKLREDSETLWHVWQNIEKFLWYKLRSCPAKKVKCEKLKQEFMELYERTKIKEKERESEKRHPTQMPLYYITRLGKQDEEAFRSSLYRWRGEPSKVGRRYGKIYKI
jgi:hypothetical protein